MFLGMGKDAARGVGLGQVGRDHLRDLRRDLGSAGVFRDELRGGKGQRLDHAIGDGDAQGAGLRLGRHPGKAGQREGYAKRADEGHGFPFPGIICFDAGRMDRRGAAPSCPVRE